MAIRNAPNGYQFEPDIGFRLQLTRPALEEIEACRNGRETTFHLTVHSNIVGYSADGNEPTMQQPTDPWSGQALLNAGPNRVYRPHAGQHSIILQVPQSEWIKQLQAAGYQRSLLVEIPFSDGSAVSGGERHLHDAHEAFCQGRYSDAVSRCRDALDAVIPVRVVGQRQLFKAAMDEDSRREMTTEDAFGLAWASIRQIMNTTHHRNGTHVGFTRPMAQFVLGATALALNLAGRERDIFVRTRQGSEA